MGETNLKHKLRIARTIISLCHALLKLFLKSYIPKQHFIFQQLNQYKVVTGEQNQSK